MSSGLVSRIRGDSSENSNRMSLTSTSTSNKIFNFRKETSKEFTNGINISSNVNDRDRLIFDDDDIGGNIDLDDHHSSNNLHRPTILGFTNPLTLRWFFSVIGAEYCHTYFWIVKDLAWMQSWRHLSITFGLLALTWSLLILYHSLRTLNLHELWNFIALFLWLFANYWWMIGEAHDYEFPDEISIAPKHTAESADILQAALLWVIIYYLVILPFKLIPCSKTALAAYDTGEVKPRCACLFARFRHYENLHMLFWISKDLAWNQLNLPVWLLSMCCTLLLAVDFIYLTAINPNIDDYTVDIVHFTVTLIWVIGNSVWAYGDFFMQDYSEPMRMWEYEPDAYMSAQWYSSWIVFIAMVPILVMYGIWGTLTLTGRLLPEYGSDGGIHGSSAASSVPGIDNTSGCWCVDELLPFDDADLDDLIATDKDESNVDSDSASSSSDEGEEQDIESKDIESVSLLQEGRGDRKVMVNVNRNSRFVLDDDNKKHRKRPCCRRQVCCNTSTSWSHGMFCCRCCRRGRQPTAKRKATALRSPRDSKDNHSSIEMTNTSGTSSSNDSRDVDSLVNNVNNNNNDSNSRSDISDNINQQTTTRARTFVSTLSRLFASVDDYETNNNNVDRKIKKKPVNVEEYSYYDLEKNGTTE